MRPRKRARGRRGQVRRQSHVQHRRALGARAHDSVVVHAPSFRVIGAKRCYPSSGLGPTSPRSSSTTRTTGSTTRPSTRVVRRRRTPRSDVTFRINEGTPIRLDTLRMKGWSSSRTRRAFLKNLQLQVGGRFGRDLMVADVDTIVNRLRNAGYPRANYCVRRR